VALLSRVIYGLRALFRNSETERELDEELRSFVETAIEQKLRTGMPIADANRAVRVEVGSLEAVKDRVRDVGWETRLESIWCDVRYAARTLRKSPAFTAAAVLTLALGIGANTAIFSALDAILIRELPYTDSDRLVMVWEDATSLGFPHNTPAPGNYAEWTELNHAFTAIAATRDVSGSLTADGLPEHVKGRAVTSNFFSVLGVQPLLGRLIQTIPRMF
jgi:putative ABC transport system permease protein